MKRKIENKKRKSIKPKVNFWKKTQQNLKAFSQTKIKITNTQIAKIINERTLTQTYRNKKIMKNDMKIACYNKLDKPTQGEMKNPNRLTSKRIELIATIFPQTKAESESLGDELCQIYLKKN